MDLTEPHRSSDPLDGLLDPMRMSGAFYCHAELTAAWGFELVPLPGFIWFHVVADGGFELEGGDVGTASFGTGEVAVVTHGAGHVLRSQPGVRTPGILELERIPVNGRYERLIHGQGGEPSTLLCGAVRFDSPMARQLVVSLPGLLRLDGSSGSSIDALMGVLASEARSQRAGSEAVIRRLADVLVIEAIREFMRVDVAAEPGWLGALGDPDIGPALVLIHEQPARTWTVDTLAREVAMSRSAFAARFRELVGEPPVAYVARWRMQVAYDRLRADRPAVAELANELGYGSEAAFARAFKRVVGTTPGAVRAASGDRSPEVDALLAG